jgi:hypothetical protein
MVVPTPGVRQNLPMSEVEPTQSDSDSVPAPAVFQRDPVRTRRRRRIGLALGALALAGWWALGLITPPGRLVFALFLAPPTILLALLARAWWNTDPVKVVIDSTGITKASRHVPWSQVRSVMLDASQLSWGEWYVTFLVSHAPIGRWRRLSFSAQSVDADVRRAVDAFELFAPADVLDASLRLHPDGPAPPTSVE